MDGNIPVAMGMLPFVFSVCWFKGLIGPFLFSLGTWVESLNQARNQIVRRLRVASVKLLRRQFELYFT